jgi:hypothetical protein
MTNYKLTVIAIGAVLTAAVGCPLAVSAAESPVQERPGPMARGNSVDDTGTGSNSSATESDDVSAEESRDEVLAWLEQYLTQQVLFNKEDLDAVRAKVAQMTPSQLQKWLDTTKQIRATLASDEWQQTRAWLKEYAVEMYYSDKEIQKFRDDAGKMSPDQLQQLLERIQRKHESAAAIQAAVTEAKMRTRPTQSSARFESQAAVRLGWQRNYLEKQEASKKAAAERNHWNSRRPLYGSQQGHAAKSYRGSPRYNQPLISSRDTARAAVRNSVFPGYRRGW